jgi:hypothetical protein
MRIVITRWSMCSTPETIKLLISLLKHADLCYDTLWEEPLEENERVSLIDSLPYLF